MYTSQLLSRLEANEVEFGVKEVGWLLPILLSFSLCLEYGSLLCSTPIERLLLEIPVEEEMGSIFCKSLDAQVAGTEETAEKEKHSY